MAETSSNIIDKIRELEDELIALKAKQFNPSEVPNLRDAEERIEYNRKSDEVEQLIKVKEAELKEATEQENREIAEKIKNNEPIPNRTEKELKQLAMEMCTGAVFSDWNISKYDYQSSFTSVFMVMALADPATLPPNIGMVYEHISQAGPRSVNGYPMFMSCKMLSREDSEKLWTMLQEMRKELGDESES